MEHARSMAKAQSIPTGPKSRPEIRVSDSERSGAQKGLKAAERAGQEN